MSDKQVVLITGCSDGGLGSALAITFHKTGHYRVIATARNLSKLTETRALGIEEIQLDVLSSDSLAAAAKQLSTLTSGRLDMLVNNAGEGYNAPVVDSDLDRVRKTFELNVYSIISVTQAFLPLLLSNPNGAKIVNNVSVAAVTAVPFQATYNASKSAALAYTNNMRLELSAFNIQVIGLMTGAVRTKFFDNVTKNAAASSSDATPTVLAEDSIYRVVPGGIKILNDPEGTLMKDAEDAGRWAKNVVADLSRKNPAPLIWRGNSAGTIRVASHLPSAVTDPLFKNLAGMNVLDKAVKEQKKNQ